MKKIGLLLVCVCASAFADPFVHPPIPNEACIAGGLYKAASVPQIDPRDNQRTGGTGSYHERVARVRATPYQSYPQSAGIQPYFSGFCNPAFPSSCPR